MRRLAVLVPIAILVGCGGGKASPSQLADGSRPPGVPPALSDVGDGAMTRITAVSARELDASTRAGCDLLASAGNPTVVKRVGADGSSLTFRDGSSLLGCDAIPNRYPDPDLPKTGGWCGGSVGRLPAGVLRDPRLHLCTGKDGGVTAFAWVRPTPAAAWIAVRSGGHREIYPAAAGLPIRVTTTDDVNPEGSATFAIEEYGREGTRLRRYELHAAVAG